MHLFKKIISELDEKIDRDAAEKEQQTENEKFSLKTFIADFFAGRVLIKKGFLRFFYFLLFVWVLSLYYIGMRYEYEKLQEIQTELRKNLQRVECERLILIKEFTKESTRSEIKKKLQEHNSKISDN